MIDPFATHLFVLAACASRGSGPILEIGGGEFSTPLLHAIARTTGARMHSFDFDIKWSREVEWVREAGKPGNTRVWSEHVESWDAIAPSVLKINLRGGMVFVDCWPGSLRGLIIAQIQCMRDAPRMIIAHDTEDPAPYGYEIVLPRFKHRRDFKRLTPWTSVVSDTDDLEWMPMEL